MFKVTFSDNRTIEVKASSKQAAENLAYRYEPVYTIVDVVPV